MLDLDDNACRRLDIGPVDLAVWSRMGYLPALLRKLALPLPVPVRLVFPPRIAVPTRHMGPVMHHASSALRQHCGPAVRARPPAACSRLASLAVYKSVLHNPSTLPVSRGVFHA